MSAQLYNDVAVEGRGRSLTAPPTHEGSKGLSEWQEVTLLPDDSGSSKATGGGVRGGGGFENGGRDAGDGGWGGVGSSGG